MMNSTSDNPRARLEREVQREREQRHKNDDTRAGNVSDDDLRSKDARESASSGQLKRQPGR